MVDARSVTPLEQESVIQTSVTPATTTTKAHKNVMVSWITLRWLTYRGGQLRKFYCIQLVQICSRIIHMVECSTKNICTQVIKVHFSTFISVLFCQDFSPLLRIPAVFTVNAAYVH